MTSARAEPSQPSWRYLHLLGSLGPCAAALLVMGWTSGWTKLRAFFRSVATLRGARVALAWGVVFPTALFIASAIIMGWRLHLPVHWDRIGSAPEYPALGPFQYVGASLLFYGFGEEIGWRGFVYPVLRRRLSPLLAALLVVPLWAVWHLPLFFATESYRTMGVGGAVGWVLSLASGSILTAWLYERARGSVLPAAVLHGVLDVFFLANIGVPVQSVLGAAVTVWGAVVAIHLFRRRRTSASTRGIVPWQTLQHT